MENVDFSNEKNVYGTKSFFFFLSQLIFIKSSIIVKNTGSPFFYQKRVGIYKNFFLLIKFRTMRLKTKHVGTHLVDKTLITTLGKFLRITNLDEIPQLFNVIKGDMSLVGPRPCLFNQKKLTDKDNYHSLKWLKKKLKK